MSIDGHNTRMSNRSDAVQYILNGKFDVHQGLKELCQALKYLRCGKEYEAELNIVNGIHHIKQGLCQIGKGLHKLRGIVDCEDLREIKEGIFLICQALDCLCGVLKDICCGRVCEAEEALVKAIRQIEKGLCKIEKGLEDLYLC